MNATNVLERVPITPKTMGRARGARSTRAATSRPVAPSAGRTAKSLIRCDAQLALVAYVRTVASSAPTIPKVITSCKKNRGRHTEARHVRPSY
jgi:hypothetical protein